MSTTICASGCESIGIALALLTGFHSKLGDDAPDLRAFADAAAVSVAELAAGIACAGGSAMAKIGGISVAIDADAAKGVVEGLMGEIGVCDE